MEIVSAGIEANAESITIRNGQPIVNAIDLTDPTERLTGASVSIGGLEEFQEDMLRVSAPVGSPIEATFDQDEGILILRGEATAADYEALLDTLVFSYTGLLGSNPDLSLTYSVDELLPDDDEDFVTIGLEIARPAPPRPPVAPAPVVVTSPVVTEPDGTLRQTFSIDNSRNPAGGLIDIGKGVGAGTFELFAPRGSAFQGQVTEKARETAEADAAYAEIFADNQQEVRDGLKDMIDQIIDFVKEIREVEVDLVRTLTKASSGPLVFDGTRGEADTLQTVKLKGDELTRDNVIELRGIEKAFIESAAQLVKNGPGFLFASGGDQHITLTPGAGPSGIFTAAGDDVLSVVGPGQPLTLPGGTSFVQFNGGTGVNMIKLAGQFSEIVMGGKAALQAPVVAGEADGDASGASSSAMVLSLGGQSIEIDNVQILATDDGLHLLDNRAALRFDEAQYLRLNPDVRQAVEAGQIASGRAHFESFGSGEHRAVGLPFDEAFYLRQNPDVAAGIKAGLVASALDHFERFGIYEGRDPIPLFDTASYLAENPDVAAAVEAGVVTAYEHFILFGDREGRGASNLFDSDVYYALNPDVAEAGVQALTHLYEFGISEGRAFNPADVELV